MRTSIETLLQDLRFGARNLGKAPGFTAIAVIALALGIGANAAMFSIVNAVLLRPLPYAEPDRLVKLYTSMPQFREASVSYPNFLDWQQRSRSFDLMAAYRGDNFNLTGQASPERLRGVMASSTMFDVLGVKPIIGRVVSRDEDQKGGAPVVVLTSDFWRTRFGGDPQVLGRTITLTDRLYTIIGVVPSDDVVWRRASVVVPIGQWTEPLFWNRGVGMGMRVVGRLKGGTTMMQAQSELDGIAAGLAREYPTENKDKGINTVSMRADLTGDVRTPLLVLLGAVGFVLLMACANVANLLLARATSRRRELAIRGALGATRGRMVRQLLTESLLLSIIGAAAGLAIAASINGVFVAKIAAQLPRASEIHLDSTVLGFTALVALAASLLFGTAPALRSAGADVNEAMKEGVRGTTTRHRLLAALVVVEVALGLVLTASAGLMMRTMTQLWSVNPGFDPQNVLSFGVAGSPAVHGTPTAVRNGLKQTVDQLRSVPGIEAVSMLLGGLPMDGDSELPYWVEGRPKPAEQSQMDLALFYAVDPDYLKVMRIPLLRGRFVAEQDNENTPCVAAVDEEFMHKAFPGENPLGQHINFELLPMKCEIVGIVAHIKHWGLDSDATANVRSQLYLSTRQLPDAVMDLASTNSDYVVRTAGVDPYAIVPPVKQAIARVSTNMVVFGEQSMREVISNSLSARRFTRLLLGSFAMLALVLATVGIYGVVSYAVTQATQEIGIRMALGADRGTVLRAVLKGAMTMAVIGIAVGAVSAFAATRVMKDLLFGVTASDPLTFGAVACLLATVTLAASYIPALRATKVDPIVALRYE